MPRELFERSTRGARLAAVVAAALATGVVVGVSSLGPGVDQLRTVAGGSSSASSEASPHGAANGHQKSAEKQKSNTQKSDKRDGGQRPKPDADDDEPGRSEAGARGVHGRCVSAVARDKDAVGGPHDNHGWAVSRAALSCPHPTPKPSPGN